MIFGRLLPEEVRAPYRIEGMHHLFTGLHFGICINLLAVIVRLSPETPFRDYQTAFVGSAAAFGCLFVSLWARKTMRGKRLAFLVRVRSLARLSLLGLLLSDNMWWFCGVVAVAWILELATEPAHLDIIKSLYPAHLFGKVISLLTIEFNIGSIIGLVATGTVMEYGIPGLVGPVSYKVVIPIGVLFGLGAIWRYSQLPFPDSLSDIPPSKEAGNPFSGLFSANRTFRHLMLITMVFGSFNALAEGLYPIFLIAQAEGTEGSAGYLQATSLGAILISSLIWGRLSDRYNPLRVLSVVILCFALASAIFAVSQNVWHLIPAYLLLGCGYAGGGIIPVKIISNCSSEGTVQHYWSVYLVWIGIRGVLFPQVGVTLYKAIGSFEPVFIITASIMLGSIVLNEWWVRRSLAHNSEVHPQGSQRY